MSSRKRAGQAPTPERILDVTAALFHQHGYAGTSLSMVAAEVGVTKAALYYHFPSKDEMLLTIVGPLLDKIDALLAGRPPHLTEATERWQFILDYAETLQTDERALAVLAVDNPSWMSPALLARIAHHRDRTVELAMPPAASAEEQLRAVLAMDIVHREIVFAADRMVLSGVDTGQRRELALRIARQTLEGRGSG